MNKKLITSGSYTYFLNRDEEEIEINVYWQYWPGMKAPREFGCPMGPDDEGEMEIIKAVDMNNFEVDLTEEEENNIIEELNGIELMDYRED